MRKIRICDVTMKQVAEGFALSFKEKIEMAKLLDKLGADLECAAAGKAPPPAGGGSRKFRADGVSVP